MRAKLFWVVVCTWLKMGGAFALHGLSGVFHDAYAVYFLVVLSMLTWVLCKAIPLQKEARVRSMKLLRTSIVLGPA